MPEALLKQGVEWPMCSCTQRSVRAAHMKSGPVWHPSSWERETGPRETAGQG